MGMNDESHSLISSLLFQKLLQKAQDDFLKTKQKQKPNILNIH